MTWWSSFEELWLLHKATLFDASSLLLVIGLICVGVCLERKRYSFFLPGLALMVVSMGLHLAFWSFEGVEELVDRVSNLKSPYSLAAYQVLN